MIRDQLNALESNQRFIKNAINNGWFISKLYEETEGLFLELTSENKILSVQFCFDELRDDSDVLLWINKNYCDGSYSPIGKHYASQIELGDNRIILK